MTIEAIADESGDVQTVPYPSEFWYDPQIEAFLPTIRLPRPGWCI